MTQSAKPLHRPNIHPVVKTLRRERLAQELTQADVADKAEVARATLIDWELGRVDGRTLWAVDRCLNVLGLKLTVARLKSTNGRD